MEKVIVYQSILSDGCGACYCKYFLDAEGADASQREDEEGWGEPCVEEIETYVGSAHHRAALGG